MKVQFQSVLSSAEGRGPRVICCALVWTLALGSCTWRKAAEQASHTTTKVFVTRHAERDGLTMSNNPPLTLKGEARARELVDALPNKLHAIYVTQLQRTQQTAAPTAKARGLRPQVWKDADPEGLAKRIQEHHRGQNVLVVSHSYAIPRFLRAMGIEAPGGAPEYGQLYVLSLDGTGARMRLKRYGE